MQAQVGFYPAYGTTDSIILPGAVKGKDLELPTPRQKFHAEKGEPRLSLCDFVAPRGYNDFIGVKLWGYSPEEDLTMRELSRAAYQGIRPAVGYQSLPDQKLIFPLSKLLDFKALSIQLTENGAMYPQSSVCGIYISSPHSRYFAVGKN